jgi:pilus assembly protein CpaB
MRGKVLIIIAALALGGVAAFMTYSYLGSLERQATAGGDLVGAYVAKQDIARGVLASDLLSKDLVEQVRMPKRYVAEGAVTTLDSISGRVLASPVSKGEILTTGRFQSPSETGLAFTVPEGFVAVTIPVDDARGVAGLVSPGDHVAILATVAKKSITDQETRIIVPGVQVLAVGQNTAAQTQATQPAQAGGPLTAAQDASGSKPGPTTIVTVAISAVDAEKVVFAIESGSIWLALLPGASTNVSPGAGQTALTVLR